jgi:hypothetical protein
MLLLDRVVDRLNIGVRSDGAEVLGHGDLVGFTRASGSPLDVLAKRSARHGPRHFRAGTVKYRTSSDPVLPPIALTGSYGYQAMESKNSPAGIV